MRQLKLLPALALLASAAIAQSPAPSCQARALKTVEDARRQAISRANDAARRLLDQADRECGTSYAVLAGIAQVYEQLGDALSASLYNRNAQKFVAQKSGALVAASGGGAAPSNPAPSAEKTLVRQKFALIVGIGSFQNPGIPSLKFAAKDARDFSKLLLDPDTGRFFPENVTLITDEQATARNIRSALADIARKALNDDLVLLYFSTHGSSPAADQSKIASGYLVTHDTDAKDLYATGYGMDELANFLRQKVRAERIVTFLDTCYSGDTTRILQQTGSKGLEVVNSLSSEAIGQVAQGKGSVVITSSSNRELSWESDDRENSFFTVYLMESLRSRQGLGTITQIFTDIQRTIPAAVRDYTLKKGLGEKGKGAEQNPGIYPMNAIPDIVIGTPTK